MQWLVRERVNPLARRKNCPDSYGLGGGPGPPRCSDFWGTRFPNLSTAAEFVRAYGTTPQTKDFVLVPTRVLLSTTETFDPMASIVYGFF